MATTASYSVFRKTILGYEIGEDENARDRGRHAGSRYDNSWKWQPWIKKHLSFLHRHLIHIVNNHRLHRA